MFLAELENTLKGVCPDEKLGRGIVVLIGEAYGEEHRHYHNLRHLDFVYQKMLAVKNEISDWNAIIFAIAFHDVVYDPARNDNEEQSAVLAMKYLKSLHVPDSTLLLVNEIILASKSHLHSDSYDVNSFCDADLAILGADERTYNKYVSGIRNEYAVYSDSEFNAGRKKVLEHFLNMQRIFKTEHFFLRYEEKARLNLRRELRSL